VWYPQLVASPLQFSQETLYQHVFAYKTHGGDLSKKLRCHKQKRNRYGSGRDRWGQRPNRRPLSECPAYIVGLKQLFHNECGCGTIIGANHKQAVMTAVARDGGYGVMVKVLNKTANMLKLTINKARGPFAFKGKTLTYETYEEYCGHALVDAELKSTGHFARPIVGWEHGSNVDLRYCHYFYDLLRQYVPMQRQMKNINNERIKMIENRLNNRPRK